MDVLGRELIGAVAAVLTTASFVPQAWRIIRTRDTAAISLAMYVSFGVGTALWIAYGWLMASPPVVIANSVTLILVMTVIALKLRHG